MFLVYGFPPKPMRNGGLGKIKFHVHVWTFHAIFIKITFSEIATSPLPTSFVHFWTFKAFSKMISLSELNPNFLCLKENPYHSWESQFFITLYMETRSSVLEIIFKGFLQISLAAICHTMYFL